MKKLDLSLGFCILLVCTLFSVRTFSQIVIDSENFETGMGIWSVSGNSARINNSSPSCDGTRSIRMRENSSAILSSSTLNLTSYTQVDISFCHKANSNVDTGEGVNLEYFDGTSWIQLQQYRRGTEFSTTGNSNPHNFSFSITTGGYTFPANAQFRIVNNTNSTDERNFIDNIEIEGYTGVTTSSEVIVSVNWPTWSGENRVEVYDPSGTLISTIDDGYDWSNGTYSTSINLGCLTDANNYYIVMYDLWGDGWNGSGDNVTVSVGGVNVINLTDNNSLDSSGTTVYFNVSGDSCGTPSPEINITGNGNTINSGDTTPSTIDDTDFGDADIASGSVTNTFTIQNTGSATLSLTGSSPYITISGTNAADFSVTAIPSASIVGSGSTTFNITFNPSAVGARTATISIANDDSDENPYTFDIEGNGTVTVPEINLTGNGNSIATGDSTPSTTDDTDFGNVDVASGSVTNTFTIQNTGTGTLSLTGSSPYVSISGTHASDFSVTATPSASISASGSTTFNITFNPSAAGTRSATISIANDDSDENPYTFDIQGNGFISLPEINIQGNGTSITNGDATPSTADDTDFGNVNHTGGTAVHTFTIQNTGTATLSLTDSSPYVTVSGTHASDFTVTATPSASISASGSTTFNITFDPSATGLRTATISIANDDSDENPYTFNVQGTGTVVTQSQVIVSVNWPSWSGENRVEIYNPSGSLISTIDNGYNGSNNGAYSTSVDLGCLDDANNYYIIMYDTYGDGWNGGGDSVTVNVGGTDVLNLTDNNSLNSSGTTAYFNVSGNSCAPSAEINIVGNSNNINSGDTTPNTADDTDFGNADVASGSVVNTFTIENIGLGTLNLTGASPYVTISGTNAGDFSVSATPAATISASGSTSFDITFNPSALGLRTATISIANDDSDENPYTFAIQGTGITTAQEINITGAGNTIVSGDVTPSGTDNTDFGNVVSASGTNTNTFIIENQGTVNTLYLTGSSPYVNISGTHAADFTVTTIPSNSIAGSSTTSFVITFDPSADGLRQASVTIANNDSDEGTYTFNIQGNGYTPPPCGTTVLHTADFEAGMDGWTDGGTDAQRILNSGCSYSNSYSLEIRNQDAVGNNASVLSPLLDLGGYDKVDFKFHFTANGFENNEEFYLEYSDDSGSNWTTVTTYHCGDTSSGSGGKDGDFLYGTSLIFYSKTATLMNSDFSFPVGSTSQFRIRCGGNETNDLLYLDYFTISGTQYCVPTTAPGGVTTNLDLWLKADQVDGISVGTDGAGVTQWFDTGKGNHAEATIAAQAPTYRNNATDNFNFNPVIEFDNDHSSAPGDMTYLLTGRDVLKGTGGFNSNDMFVVIIPDVNVTTGMSPMDTFTGDDPSASSNSYSEDVTGFGYGNYTTRLSNEYLAYCIGSSAGYGSGDTSASTDLNDIGIINFRHNSSNSGQEIHFNGVRVDDTSNNTSNFTAVNNSRYFLGRSQYWGGSFNGRIAEIVTYSSTNSDASDTDLRNRIQSYLAVKYGITIAPDSNGTTRDYVNSDGTVIWDQSATGFNHDIAGIGRDDASELNQKQSSSINNATDGSGPIEGILSIGLTDIYNTNSDNVSTNPTTLNDKEFLMWGNNGADLNLAATTINVDMSSGVTGLTTPVTFTGMQRIWKIVETGGDIPSVKVSLPENAIRNITPPGSFLMFISDTNVFDPTADYRIMTSDGSGNLETDYDFDGTKYITFGYAPQIIAERSVYFNGVADYIDVSDNLDLNTTEFTISAWVKRDAGSTNASIVSKRNAANSEGYDLRLDATGRVQFTLNGNAASLTSSVVIPENQWHQIAVIYNAGTATIYIDGVADTTASSLPAPINNTQSFLIGAADGFDPNTTDFFTGNIDEVRVWDIALSIDQLRYIMNQEIIDDASLNLEYGDIIPSSITKNEISSIPWSNLAGYYPMHVFTYTNTNDMSGNNHQGALRNLNTVDYQTAPLPYETQASGSWDDNATWLNNADQILPNSLSIVDGTTSIDWNIVQINNDIYLGDSPTAARSRNCTVQGLIINSGELQVNGDNGTQTGIGLTVSHYLKLDGTIDLEGESQLIQTDNSDLDVTSAGNIEKDQQGTRDFFTYNFWSSPVSVTSTSSNNNSFTLSNNILKNGTVSSTPTNITFLNSGYNGNVSGTDISIADYWIWKFTDQLSSSYGGWEHVRSTGTLNPGEGFTMKGVANTGGTVSLTQNYVFDGKPNNGDITLSVSAGNGYLIGNPYPSALDADEFIKDNISNLETDGRNTSGNVINGAVYFWDHFGGGSHNLRDYEGGYSSYTLMGGIPAVANDARMNNTGAIGTKTPGRYIPVGQGFFVFATADSSLSGEPTDPNLSQPIVGGDIILQNSQRVFQSEASTASTFMKNTKGKSKSNANTNIDTREKIRLMFDSPGGYHREILVGVNENTSKAFDVGYDAILVEENVEDMYWTFNATNYMIQSVDNFNEDQTLPLGVKINTEGLATLRLKALENIDSNKNIYLYDSELSIYHNLKDSNYEVHLVPGEYLNRFEIVFKSQQSLSTDDLDNNTNTGVQMYYSNERRKIIVHNSSMINIESVELYNILGQSTITFKTDSNDNYLELNAKTINTGVYLIKVKTEHGSTTKKVLVK